MASTQENSKTPKDYAATFSLYQHMNAKFTDFAQSPPGGDDLLREFLERLRELFENDPGPLSGPTLH